MLLSPLLLDVGFARAFAAVLVCPSVAAEDCLSLLLRWRMARLWFGFPVIVRGRRRSVDRRSGRVDMSRRLSPWCRRLVVRASVVVIPAVLRICRVPCSLLLPLACRMLPRLRRRPSCEACVVLLLGWLCVHPSHLCAR